MQLRPSLPLRLPLPLPLVACAVLLGSACNDESDSFSGTDSPPPSPAATSDRPPPTFDPAPPEEDAGPPPRHVDGTLLVAGKVRVIGVTDDGWLAWFRMAPGEVAATFEVFDTKTKKTVSLGPAGSANDTALVRGKGVALWTRLRGPYGWGGLTVWTEASGVTSEKSASSLPGLFATNDDATRLAFTFGLPANQGGITQLATSVPSGIAAPQIVATNVGIGDKTTRCTPTVGFHGARLFTSSCEGSQTTGTVRMVDAAGAVTTVRTGARPQWSATPNGDRVLVTTGTGNAELHAMPSNDVVPVASDVASAVLTPDGATIVYTTTSGSLRRAPIANPSAVTTLVASAAREILAVAPDGKHVVVASLPPESATASTYRTDLHLVALDPPSVPTTMTPLVETKTGMSYGFTRSGSHVLYITDLTGIGLDGMKVRARPVNGGPEVVIGKEIRGLVQPASSTKIVYLEKAPNYRYDVKVIDLEKNTASKLLLDDVESATAMGDTAYVGVGSQGLYAIPL